MQLDILQKVLHLGVCCMLGCICFRDIDSSTHRPASLLARWLDG